MIIYFSLSIKEGLKKLSLYSGKKRYTNFQKEKAEKLKKILSKKKFFRKYDHYIKEKNRNLSMTKKFSIKL